MQRSRMILLAVTMALAASRASAQEANGAQPGRVAAAPEAAATASRSAPAIKAESPEATIRHELDRQTAAWNHGDLKGYMQGYWHSPELTFFAGAAENAGWEAALKRYREAYQGQGREMGSLRMVNIRVTMLAPDSALVRGGWQLTMKDKSQRKGLFTLIFRKMPEGWRIIHDHSS